MQHEQWLTEGNTTQVANLQRALSHCGRGLDGKIRFGRFRDFHLPPPDPAIRRMAHSDIVNVAPLLQVCLEHPPAPDALHTALKEADAKMLVAEVEGKISSYIEVVNGRVTTLVTDPGWRGYEIASKLVKHAVQTAPGDLHVSLPPENGAVPMYESIGFREDLAGTLFGDSGLVHLRYEKEDAKGGDSPSVLSPDRPQAPTRSPVPVVAA